MISETKFGEFFPDAQFSVKDFRTPLGLDCKKHSWGMLLNIRNYINTVLLTDYVFPNDIEAFFIEIKVNTYKWLICYSYNPMQLMFQLYTAKSTKIF